MASNSWINKVLIKLMVLNVMVITGENAWDQLVHGCIMVQGYIMLLFANDLVVAVIDWRALIERMRVH